MRREQGHKKVNGIEPTLGGGTSLYDFNSLPADVQADLLDMFPTLDFSDENLARYKFGKKPLGSFGSGNYKLFTEDGTFTFQPGVQYRLRVVGGGGGGAIQYVDIKSIPDISYLTFHSGGAGGGYAEKLYSTKTEITLSITIGTGGVGGILYANDNTHMAGTSGGTTSIGTILSATGGGGAVSNGTSATQTAEGGMGVGGDYNYKGGWGSRGGGGGAAASDFGNGGFQIRGAASIGGQGLCSTGNMNFGGLSIGGLGLKTNYGTNTTPLNNYSYAIQEVIDNYNLYLGELQGIGCPFIGLGGYGFYTSIDINNYIEIKGNYKRISSPHPGLVLRSGYSMCGAGTGFNYDYTTDNDYTPITIIPQKTRAFNYLNDSPYKENTKELINTKFGLGGCNPIEAEDLLRKRRSAPDDSTNTGVLPNLSVYPLLKYYTQGGFGGGGAPFNTKYYKGTDRQKPGIPFFSITTEDDPNWVAKTNALYKGISNGGFGGGGGGTLTFSGARIDIDWGKATGKTFTNIFNTPPNLINTLADVFAPLELEMGKGGFGAGGGGCMDINYGFYPIYKLELKPPFVGGGGAGVYEGGYGAWGWASLYTYLAGTSYRYTNYRVLRPGNGGLGGGGGGSIVGYSVDNVDYSFILYPIRAGNGGDGLALIEW